MASKVTKCEPRKKWEQILVSKNSRITELQIFKPIEGGTKLTLIFEAKTGGFMKLLSPMIASSIRSETKENLSTLKTILEGED